MNREIKFRVYDKELKQYVREAEGFHVLGEVMAFGVLEMYMRENPCDKMYLIRWDDMVLQQFTGLKDKNGRDIYEGDVIRKVNSSSFVQKSSLIFEVVFENYSWRMKLLQVEQWEKYTVPVPEVGTTYTSFAAICNADIEVIGNSFETPYE